MSTLSRARGLALAVPVLLLLGAYGFQLIGHLAPCEMCWWQRYPLFAAVVFAVAAMLTRATPASRLFVALAGLSILISGLIGGYHAGVEYHWWTGPERCTSSGFTSIADLMKAPVVMCDVPQWTLWGVSLAGFNFIISTLAGLVVLALSFGRRAR